MESLEISAKTVEEATKKALTQLNVTLDEVEITVLSEGKSGILGLGSEDACISVKLRDDKNNQDSEAKEITKDILESLLAKMGVRSKRIIESLQTVSTDEGESNYAVFNIVGEDLGILIGRRGQTLDALQYLVRLIVSRKTKSRIPIMIDVENYKQRRYDELRALALNVANQVKTKGSSIRLEPMSAYERRIVHLTLVNDEDVDTESIGEGDARRVIVSPKHKN